MIGMKPTYKIKNYLWLGVYLTAIWRKASLYYKFIVDGKWMTDSDNPIREYDGKGNINSVCIIK
ncbi:hypothetical protein GCM10022396_26690 [Flavivirga amylovorans]